MTRIHTGFLRTCIVTLSSPANVSARFVKNVGTMTATYYHTDAIGSVRAVTSEAGATVKRHDYGPFGTDNQPMTGDPIRFAGKELDPETGQHYSIARYYRNTWGRFLTVDPLAGNPGNPQTLNPYTYALNNPLRFVDPLGLQGEGEGRTVCRIDPARGVLVCNLAGSGIMPQPGDDQGIGENCGGDPDCDNGEGPPGGIVLPPVVPPVVPPVPPLPLPVPPDTPPQALTAIINRVKQRVCSLIPNGRTVGGSLGFGGVVGGVGGSELVVNFDSGQVSFFGFAGAQTGWNGGVSASAHTGFVWGLNKSNSNYKGGFTGLNGSLFGAIGGFVSSSSGGLSGGAKGLAPNFAVNAAGLSAGAALAPPTFGANATNYSKPLQLGKYWGLGVADLAFFAARQACR